VIATIASHGSGFIKRVKARPDVELIQVTERTACAGRAGDQDNCRYSSLTVISHRLLIEPNVGWLAARGAAGTHRTARTPKRRESRRLGSVS
jgi:hypothetical protein